MAEHLRQDLNMQLEETYQRMFVSRDLTNKEQLLREKDEDSRIKVVVGFKSAFGKLFKIAKKVGKSKAFRNIAKTALEEARGIVQNLSRNVKNKRLQS